MARRILPLTEEKIKAAKSQEKPRRLFDGGGLYLEITPHDSRLWRMKIRINNRERVLSFGKYPGVSLEQARRKREEARRMKAAGLDPAEERKAQKRAKLDFQAIQKEKELVRHEMEKLSSMTLSELLREKISIRTLASILVSLSEEDILRTKKVIEQFRI